MGDSKDGLYLTQEEINGYIDALQEKGRSPGTIQTYRHCLDLLSRSLPVDQRIGPDALLTWQGQLLAEGYRPATVNTCLSVVNSFLDFLGRRDLQLPGTLQIPANSAPPELKRSEYLRLLQTAKLLGKERLYLIIKSFALTGIPVQELHKLTAEAACLGQFTVISGGIKRWVQIPACLQGELIKFSRRQGICSGPLFRTRTGRPLGRTNVSDAIRALCRDANIAPEKGNPRCLRKLYLETRESIQAGLQLLAEQTYDSLFEREQLSVGWEDF